MTFREAGSGLGLPSPETLERLEKLSPGFTEFVQRELVAHRHAKESADAEADRIRFYRVETERMFATRGQWFGFTIGVVAILSGTLAAILHAQIAGTFIGAGGVVGLVAAFVVRGRLSAGPES